MEFRILGGLEAESDGRLLTLGGYREERVLAALLLEAGRMVPMGHLVDVVWDGDPPVTAVKQVQNAVSRLRQVLGTAGAADLIATVTSGYRLAADRCVIDAQVFQERVCAADREVAEGKVAEAAGLLRSALSLWRGPVLAGLAGRGLERVVIGWDERRVAALELCLGLELRLGRHREVLGELAGLAASYPLREKLAGLYMLALYRCGRQADALEAYRLMRELLAGELGLDPGPELQGLQQQILTADPALAPQATAPALAGHNGNGSSAAAGTVGGVPEVRRVLCSLPADTAAFTGREGEAGRITAAVSGAARGGASMTIAAINGMPGVGKTALAVHAAHLLRDRFPDQCLFIDLHAHTPGQDALTPQAALAALLAAAGADTRDLPDDLDSRAALWRDTMAGQRALLVLDNAACSSQVRPLLPGGGGCLVLVTSRRHLGDLPGAVTPVPVDVLPPGQAAAMFTRLAPQAAGDGEGVAEVVALAGFLPLAISLLARVFARHRSWMLADLASETRARLLTLTAERDTVAAAFEVSYQHLDPGLQQFFRLLGAHPGTDTDPWAAAALAGTSLAQAAGHLDALHGEGLLTETGYRRYGMHDLIRRYARNLAIPDTPADGQQALDRLLDYYQHTAALAQELLAHQTRPGLAPAAPAECEVPVLDDAGHALAWARTERGSLLACLDLAARTGQHARVVALTAGIATMLKIDGPWAEASSLHAAAVNAARQAGNRLGEANALTDLGDAWRRTGDFPAAIGAFEEALGIYRDLGDRLGEANALCYLGFAQQLTGDHPGVAGVIEEALGIYRDLGDRLGEAKALHMLVWLRKESGDSPGAARFLEQSLRIYRELGDRLGETDALRSLGFIQTLAGDYLGAAAVLEEALAIARDLGARLGEAHALSCLGVARRLAGDYPPAAAALQEARRIWRELGDRLGEAAVLHELGTARQLTGDHTGAARALEEARAIYRDLGGRLGEANALYCLGVIHHLTGDYEGAAGILEQAGSIYHCIGNRLAEANAMRDLGIARSLAGDHPGAATALKQALRICRHLGYRGGEAETLNEQGTLYRVRGNPGQAQQHHQQALTLARAIGSPRDEACALAGLSLCASSATKAGVLLRQAREIFDRIGAAEARDARTGLDALTRSGPAR